MSADTGQGLGGQETPNTELTQVSPQRPPLLGPMPSVEDLCGGRTWALRKTDDTEPSPEVATLEQSLPRPLKAPLEKDWRESALPGVLCE